MQEPSGRALDMDTLFGPLHQDNFVSLLCLRGNIRVISFSYINSTLFLAQ